MRTTLQVTCQQTRRNKGLRGLSRRKSGATLFTNTKTNQVRLSVFSSAEL